MANMAPVPGSTPHSAGQAPMQQQMFQPAPGQTPQKFVIMQPQQAATTVPAPLPQQQQKGRIKMQSKMFRLIG